MVSVAIHNGERDVKKIQGIQMMAICKLLEDTNHIDTQSYYTFKQKNYSLYKIYDKYCNLFPEAKQLPSSLWGIFPYWIKYTDNEIKFGHKIIWRHNHDFSN